MITILSRKGRGSCRPFSRLHASMDAHRGPQLEEMAMILHKSLAVAAAAAAMTLTVHAAQAQNCMEVLSRTPEASDFASALVRTGQTALLRGPGPFTILAPTNDAV